jgi:hypothetical protein
MIASAPRSRNSPRADAEEAGEPRVRLYELAPDPDPLKQPCCCICSTMWKHL